VTRTSQSSFELVVLVDDAGRPLGTAPKSEVHHSATPLHLAFSCWVMDGDGRTLLTRRAATKRTWPGAWTNSFCGHPAPGEQVEDAVRRRAGDELGARVSKPVPVLPDFRYRAVMDNGTVENEICPVFTARLLTPMSPNPDEVDASRWIPFADLSEQVARDVTAFSPWLREQLQAMLHAGWTPTAG
jgi:isopentenyl-diphosphate delta-isomerase